MMMRPGLPSAWPASQALADLETCSALFCASRGRLGATVAAAGHGAGTPSASPRRVASIAPSRWPRDRCPPGLPRQAVPNGPSPTVSTLGTSSESLRVSRCSRLPRGRVPLCEDLRALAQRSLRSGSLCGDARLRESNPRGALAARACPGRLGPSAPWEWRSFAGSSSKRATNFWQRGHQNSQFSQ